MLNLDRTAFALPVSDMLQDQHGDAAGPRICDKTRWPFHDMGLLAASPVPIYVTDALGALTFFNEAASFFWGRRPALGEPVSSQWKLLDEDGAALADGDHPSAIAIKTQTALQKECRGVRADGSMVHFACSPTPLFDYEQHFVGVMDILHDRTAQERAEAERREQDEQWRHAVEFSPQMPWMADAMGRVLHLNERWCRLTGQSRKEALRHGWLNVTHPDDLPAVLAAADRASAGIGELDVRFRVRTRDSSYRWVRARARARRNEAGDVLRWYGSTEDIHETTTAQTGLAEAEERYRYAALATKDVFWDHDFINDQIVWSDGLLDTFGYPINEDVCAGAFWLGKVHPDDRDRVKAGLSLAFETGAPRWTAEYRFERADGSFAHILDCGTLLRNEEGQVVRAIGAMLDFSDRKQTEADLRLSEERLRLATAAAGLGIVDFDVANRHEHWSDELRHILGVPADSPACAETYLSLVHPDDLEAATAQNRRTRRGDFGHEFTVVRRIHRQVDGALRWISTLGHVLRDQKGSVYRVLIVVRDITEEKESQDRISWAASHDIMTGLPNKAAFQAQLSDLIARSHAAQPASLLLFDLDNFKHVNDTLGHQAGDALLIEVGSRLKAAIPASGLVARFGGDEFAVILPGVDEPAALGIARAVLATVQKPCVIDARSVDIRASVGVSTFPAQGSDASMLLQAADMALYAAKSGGRHMARAYRPEMRAGLQRQVSMLRQAREIVATKAVVPFYQPKLSLNSGALVGAEALLRWYDPRLGFQSAGTIAAAFDDPELAGQIGSAMLNAVLADLRTWLEAGQAVRRVAINVSPLEIGRRGFSEHLLSALRTFNVPAALLEVEITETALMGSHVGDATQELLELRAAGVTVALDDFGTGYSSLSHLTSFPVDAIKIDQSFIAGLHESGPNRAVVEAVIRLSGSLGLLTVAEGVETEKQARILTDLGCDIAQGHLFAAAMPARSLQWISPIASTRSVAPLKTSLMSSAES